MVRRLTFQFAPDFDADIGYYISCNSNNTSNKNSPPSRQVKIENKIKSNTDTNPPLNKANSTKQK
jgi:hypothetical protein